MCRMLELPGSRVRAIVDVSAFLAASVRRESLNQIRAARRAQARDTRVRLLPNEAPNPAGDVRTALEALPRRLREVVVLKHISELSFEQIALALATNRNTIVGRYRTALAALRAVLAPEEGVAHV